MQADEMKVALEMAHILLDKALKDQCVLSNEFDVYLREQKKLEKILVKLYRENATADQIDR